MPLLKFFGLLATCRVSLGLYNTREEIDVLVHALIKVWQIARVTGERTRGKAARVELCSFGSCTSSSSQQVSIFNFSKLEALVSLGRPAGLAADFRLQSQSTAVADRLQNRVGSFRQSPPCSISNGATPRVLCESAMSDSQQRPCHRMRRAK
ncbi:hypothetical protein ACNJYA_07715 [Bradyrhizobium sp. DASA03068]|uniref:hypothetical protein n=1 Tax=Bradyrhizobium sp. BLXBL-01 TaxID=3395915 RepID=UPI003F7208A5